MFLALGRSPEELANFIGYCLAYAANKHGVQIHACVMMSNHHHTDATDALGELPAFKQLLHSMVARGLNVRLGRTDKLVAAFEQAVQPCERPSEQHAPWQAKPERRADAGAIVT